MRALKGNVTRTGYRRDSKDRFNDFNVIPSNKISMKGVDHDVIGVSDKGDVKHMKPGGEYKFSGKTVTEFPVYQGSGVFPSQGTISQAEERSFGDKAGDFLRALSQPINYMREIGEGNYLPNQAELESEGITPIESIIALANPADHIYAALAASDVIDDPNYAKEDGVSYGSPGLVSLIAGSAPQRVSKHLDESIKTLKEAGIKTFGELSSINPSGLSGSTKEAAKDVARVVENSNQLGKALRSESGTDREFVTMNSNPAFSLRNYIMDEGAGGIVTHYDPNKPLSSDPFIQDMLNLDSDLFSRDYLTSYRGVTAENADQARHFLTNTGGSGGRAMGQGVYVTQDLDMAKRYATPGISDQIGAGSLPGKDVSGYVGKVRQQLGPHGWKNTLRDLAEREFLGSAGSERGMETTDRVRVIRPKEADAGGLQVQDIVSLDDLASSGLGAFKKGTTPDYYNWRDLDYNATPDQYLRSFFSRRGFKDGGKNTVKETPSYQGGGRSSLPMRFRNTTMYPTDEDAYNAFYESKEFKAMSDEADKDPIYEVTTTEVSIGQPFNVAEEAYKAGMDTTAFVRALAGVESGFNYRAQNPTSSAVGAHQFLWNLLKDDPLVAGVTKEQYMMDEDLQNKVMRKALTDPVAGGNAYLKDIADIREEYSPQIPGFNDMYSDLDLLLMRHLKGRQGSRQYLGNTIRDGEPENLKGLNMTFPDYQDKFYGYYNQ
jgi:hypothetical protein